MGEPLVLRGISRDPDDPNGLEVWFNREPTDDEMRAFHDANRRASPEVSEAEVERALAAFWAFIDKHGAGTGGDGPAMRAALTAASEARGARGGAQ